MTINRANMGAKALRAWFSAARRNVQQLAKGADEEGEVAGFPQEKKAIGL